MVKVFDRIRPRSIVLVGAALSMGCAPGRLTWDGERDILRTAIFKEQSSGDVHIASLLLSNSVFPCALPQDEDPSAAAQQIEALLAAACREDARHVNLRLFRQGGQDWIGSYDGLESASAALLSDQQPRIAEASYYGVEEAFLVEVGHVDRAYAVARDELELEVADGGTVEIVRDGERLVGTFAFPEGPLQGSFRAELCEADTSLLDLLEPSPSHLCP